MQLYCYLITLLILIIHRVSDSGYKRTWQQVKVKHKNIVQTGIIANRTEKYHLLKCFTCTATECLLLYNKYVDIVILIPICSKLFAD